jgi:hypothetical protein
MTRPSIARRSLLSLAALALPAAALAQGTAPAPQYQIVVQTVDAGRQTGSQTSTQPGVVSVPGATASLRVSPDVLLETSVASTTNGGASANAFMVYHFNIFGPSATSIPLLIYTALGTSASGDPRTSRGSGTAQFRVTTALGQQSIQRSCDNVSGCANDAFSGAVSILATANFFNEILLATSATAQYGAVASAFADPRIVIDPSFQNAGAYSIVMTPGVANDMAAVTSTVPEPSTFVLTAGGLALAGLVARRRRRARAA